MIEEIPPAEPVQASEGTKTPLFEPYTSEMASADWQTSGKGMSTGFEWLDAQEFLFYPGKLYAVAARPSVGKTALLLEFVMRHAEARAGLRDIKEETPRDYGHGKAPAVFVTYEERLADIYRRLLLRQIAQDADGLPAWVAENSPLRWWVTSWLRDTLKTPQAAIAEAAKKLDALMIDGHLALVDGDRDGGDVDLLLGHLTKTCRDAYGAAPSLLVVDYYQKIRPPADTRASNRQTQLQEVADKLRRFAKGELVEDLGSAYTVPVLVGAQVNRLAEGQGKEDGDPPELEHIREADDLANDAAGVLTLHRLQNPKELTVKVVKNRDGRRYKKAIFTFEESSGRIPGHGAELVESPFPGGRDLVKTKSAKTPRARK